MAMGPVFQALSLFLLFIAAGANAFGHVDCGKSDENAKTFEKFQGISDSQISADCTYGGKVARFTADCVKGFEKMRALSADYLKVKKDFCEKVANCKGDSCPAGMEDLAKETQITHEKIAELLAKGRAEIKELYGKAEKSHHRCKSDKSELDEMAAAAPKKDYGSVWKSSRMKKKGWKKYTKKKKTSNDSVGAGGGNALEAPELPESEEEGGSDISGTKSEIVDAGGIGARDLAEYREALPRLLSKQRRALEKMAEFDQGVFGAEGKHGEAAMAANGVPAATSAHTLNAAIPLASAAEKDAKKAVSAYVAVTGLEMPEAAQDELGDFSGSLESEKEPSRLKDSLRKMLAESAKQKPIPSSNMTNFAAELMAEQSGEEKKTNSQAEAEQKVIGPVDVAGASREIEYQLTELDRGRGILGPLSLTLFERVRQFHARFVRQNLGFSANPSKR